ncbi:MAG: NFYB/HAP3 family transcription factor subunit [Candidatus Hadarchaeum sp.]|uniref:histone n=1 Tax=Candidatus Hadarchaeum sp. TaxID=2883567 RepID=UPI003176AB57
MPEFLIATMIKLIKRAAKVRVSRDAALELSVVLEDYALRVAREAVKLRDHRGAKTLSKEDIRAAVAAIPK